MRFPRPVWTACLQFALANPLAAQGALTGIVRDDSTGAPLPGVEVLVERTTLRATTGANGRYLLGGVPAGRHQVVFRLVGRLPARVEALIAAGDTVRLNATLGRAEVVLDPIEVIGENPRPRGSGLEAFEERRKMGFGRFIDSSELRRSEQAYVDDVLQRHGVTILAGPSGRRFAFNPRYRNMDGGLSCLMSVFLDGIRIGEGGRIGASSLDAVGLDIRNLVPTHLVQAIEIYFGAGQIPAQFGGAAGACGAVVLWTRRGM